LTEDRHSTVARLSPDALIELVETTVAFHEALNEGRYDEATVHLRDQARALARLKEYSPPSLQRVQEAIDRYLAKEE
jgi:hypothetical protein